MTDTYTFEGVTFDLTIPYADVTGNEWRWTGGWSCDEEPLMRQRSNKGDCQTPIPFPDLYRDHGPLIPLSPRPTRAQYRAAVDQDYAATVAAGYVETPAEFGQRIAATPKPSPAPAPAVTISAPTAPAVAAAPIQSSRFQAFLRTLRRAS